MEDLAGVVMAAGEGKRMRSGVIKVLHRLSGKPLLAHVLDRCRELNMSRIIVVIGYQADKVKAEFSPEAVEFVLQEKQLGTAHAVMQAEKALEGFEGEVLVLSGDVPRISLEILKALVEKHRKNKAWATMLTTHLEDPSGYGRVIRGRGEEVERVVEDRDAALVEKALSEINTGIYCFASRPLFEALGEVGQDNVQGEFYLPEVLAIMRKKGGKVIALLTGKHQEVLGINTRKELAAAEENLRRITLENLMENGVTLMDPQNTYVQSTVKVGRDTILYPNTHLEGETVIGEGCRILPHSRILNSTLGNNITVLDSCLIQDAVVGDNVNIGPFAHLRPGSNIGKSARIGNFVEVKKSVIGEGSKVPHLSYIGDTVMGKRVNIGAGSITCNYDGIAKHQTTIGDDVFAGSDTKFVAPVTVGEGAIIAAGSTITEDVPPHALAVARAHQVNKDGWAKEKGKKKEKKEENEKG